MKIKIILTVFTLLASLITPFFNAPVPEITEDDFVPVMRFLATSDSHIVSMGDTGSKRLAKTIKSAYAISDADSDYTNLDAVVISGDLTDNGWLGSFATYAAVTDFTIREGTESLAVVAKAHDSRLFGTNTPDLYESFTGQDSDFHKVINGFHFIGISKSKTVMHYTKAQVKWLEENIAQAVAEDPSKPVFVFQHEHVLNTVYGSSKSDGWGLDNFTEVLEKFPQVIHISGHSHFPANDPRAIWQGNFTAINDGGIAYFELAVDGRNGRFPEGNDTMTQALIIEVDADNRVLVKVLDVEAGVFLREFLIDNVTEVNKTKYAPETRKANSVAPEFKDDAKLTVERDGNKVNVTVPQAQVEGDNEVFVYRINVTNEKGRNVHKNWAFSKYYFADRCESITFDTFRVYLPGTYKVEVVAEDVWGNTSTALSATIQK